MEQEHRLSYKAGITRTPSDFLCADGELAECINLATDNEEMKPMVQPAAVMDTTIAHEVRYIHKYNNDKRYIFLIFHTAPRESRINCSLHWAIEENGSLVPQSQSLDLHSDSQKLNITSIGKTLIVTDDDGIHYYMWKDEGNNKEYVNLGGIPDMKVDFYLKDAGFKENTGDFNNILNILEGRIKEQEEYNTLVVGLYSKNKKAIGQENGFCEPFFVKLALELYDGSYYYISQPILMFPSVTRNSYASFEENPDHSESPMMRIKTCYSKLYCTQETDYTYWSDIIKDVVVFATDSILLYDQSVDQPLEKIEDPNDYAFDQLVSESNRSTYSRGNGTGLSNWKVLKQRSKNDIIEDIHSSTIFHRLCSLGRKPVDNISISSKAKSHTVEFLSTQERLEEDDYYSRNKLVPNFLYTYNSRINIANISRGFFGGYDFFMPYDNVGTHNYTFYVRIKTDAELRWVSHNIQSSKQMQGGYFFYPDARADRVVIYKDDYFILDQDLKESPGLNGSYYFKGFPGIDFTNDDGMITPRIDPRELVDNYGLEMLSNYLIQSEVNNPWVFKAEGYHKVGVGEIVGMSTITQALSQGQFGQFPLIVFSKSGIWALSVNDKGVYQNIYPMSREICLNPSTITQTDGAVFFVSKKGLMIIASNGASIDVRCVSERMNGRAFNTGSLSPLANDTDWAGIVSACQDSTTFLEFIRSEDCFMAYDYIDSRILIINNDYDYSFVYSMIDGTISKTILPAKMRNAINDYPDYLLQGMDGNLYSFYKKPREEEINTRQLGFLLTRPMKLAGPVSQASLRQLKNVGTWNKSGGSMVKTELYLSEDMQTWFPDISRHGAAARYYRLALFIKMLPTERLSGTILTEQPRRSNNMR